MAGDAGAVLAVSDPVLLAVVFAVVIVGFAVWFLTMNWLDDRRERRERQEMGARWRGLP